MSTGDFTLSAIGILKDDKTDKDGNYTYTIGGNLRFNATNSITNIADKDFQIKAGEDYLMYSKAFSSVANNEDGTFTIGANNAKAVLTLNDNKGQNTTLIGEGLKFNAANNGINIVSDTSPNGIKLIATAIKDNEAQGGVSISLVPQSGGNGAFYIRSGTGTIQSNYDEVPHVGKRTYVSIGHGVVSNWGVFTGTPDSQSTTSLTAERDIRSINGWNYSNEYCYNNGYAHWCMGANRSSSKISEHLGCIYDLLNNLQTQITNEVNARKSDVNDARNKANSAISKADAAQKTANNKVDTSTYNNHMHQFKMLRSKVRIDGKESANEYIYSLSSGSGFTTSRPV